MTKPLSKAEKKEKKEIRKQQKAASKTVVKVTQPKHEDLPAVNLCDDCAYEFGECEGKPKFASDQDETLTGAEADRVVECPAFVNVSKMPTVQEASAQSPAAAEEKPVKGPRECDFEHLRDYPDCFEECDKDECDGIPAEAEETFPEADYASFYDLIIVCSGGCGKTTEGMTFETKSGKFTEAADPESMVPEWICQDCLDKAAAESEPETHNQFPLVIRKDLPERPDPKRFLAEEDFGTCPSCSRPLKRTAFNRYQDAIRCTNVRCRAYRGIVSTITTGVK